MRLGMFSMQIASTIDEEEKTDNELRSKYGEKWNRQHSSKLNAQWRAEIEKPRQLLKQASQTDKELTDRFQVQEATFEHLSVPEPELCEYVISEMDKQGSSPVQGGSSSKRKALRELCEQVDGMKKERNDLQKQIEQMTLPESLSKLFLFYPFLSFKICISHFFRILAKEFLRMYQKGSSIDAQVLATEHINVALGSARDCIRESLDKQASLLEKIQSMHESVFGKKTDGACLATKLIVAADSYDRLCQDVEQGITFYADLTGILVKFQNKVSRVY